jgi:hypothetical protein
MTQFIEKRVPIEAMQFTYPPSPELLEWCPLLVDISKARHPAATATATLQNRRREDPSTQLIEGDWLIRDLLNGFQVLKPTEFHARYDLANGPELSYRDRVWQDIQQHVPTVDTVHAVNLYFDWSWPRCGFGQCAIWQDETTGELRFDAEGMGRDNVRRMLYALADKIADTLVEDQPPKKESTDDNTN